MIGRKVPNKYLPFVFPPKEDALYLNGASTYDLLNAGNCKRQVELKFTIISGIRIGFK
jgi:hypothetical protein